MCVGGRDWPRRPGSTNMSETSAKPAEGSEMSDRAQAAVVRAGGRAGGRGAAKGGVCERAAAGVEGERVLGTG